jgi:long-subunit fatty acid transport protein
VYHDLKFRTTPLTTAPYTDVPYSHIPEFVKTDGNGWGLGFRAGLMYKVNEKTNLGISAALPFSITVKGDARLDFIMPQIRSTRNKQTDPNSVNYLFAAGGNVSLMRDFETKLKLPASFGVGLSYRVNEKLLVALDGEYTLWSSFDGLNIALAGGNGLSGAANDPSVKPFFTSDVSTEVEWKNTLKTALGARYDVNTVLTLLGGLSVDQGVNPDKVGFVPQFMDTGTKLGFNGGLQFHLQTWDLGVGGSIISNPELTVERTYESDGSLKGFPGTYKATTFETVLSVARRF